MATLDNIIAKFNMKTFGLNYVPVIEGGASRFELNSGKVLCIGYDVGHPAPLTPGEKRQIREAGLTEVQSLDPSVVGVSRYLSL